MSSGNMSSGNSAESNGTNTVNSGNSAESSGTNTVNSGNGAETSGNSAETSGNSAKNSGNSAENCGNSADSVVSSLSWLELIPRLSTTEKCIDFCRVFKLLPDRELKNCTDCHSERSVKLINKNDDRNFPLQLFCSKCKKRTAFRKNTWFEQCRFPIAQNMVLISCWVRNCSLEVAASETGLSLNTVCEYYGFCRKVCYTIVTNSTVPIGGVGKVVEIHETNIAKRKYKRGRLLKNESEHISVFGGVERDCKKCFMAKVYSSDKATLVPLIKHFILPGTKVITDGWSSYQTLQNEGFQDEFVNHSVEFVSANDPSVNTQNAERLWKDITTGIKREGRPGEHDEMYLFQYLYFLNLRLAGKKLPCETLPMFLRDISRVYPGYGLKRLKPVAYTCNGLQEDDSDHEERTN